MGGRGGSVFSTLKPNTKQRCEGGHEEGWVFLAGANQASPCHFGGKKKGTLPRPSHQFILFGWAMAPAHFFLGWFGVLNLKKIMSPSSTV
uniref:Uncharacterized protein n=1 Tax=Anguilla anguilla TaxID=7936 RepID=A0A0E9WJJ3_ANGAN